MIFADMVCLLCRRTFGTVAVEPKFKKIYDFCPECEGRMSEHFETEVNRLEFTNLGPLKVRMRDVLLPYIIRR